MLRFLGMLGGLSVFFLAMAAGSALRTIIDSL